MVGSMVQRPSLFSSIFVQHLAQQDLNWCLGLLGSEMVSEIVGYQDGYFHENGFQSTLQQTPTQLLSVNVLVQWRFHRTLQGASLFNAFVLCCCQVSVKYSRTDASCIMPPIYSLLKM